MYEVSLVMHLSCSIHGSRTPTSPQGLKRVE